MPRDYEFRWDNLEQMRHLFENMTEEFAHIMKEELTEHGHLVEEGAKALSPEDSGDLSDSINAEPAKQSGNEFKVEIGSNSVYAMRRHEEPYRAGTYDKYDNGAKFPDYYVNGKGATTRGKPRWRRYLPGRKYLENAMKATEKDFDQMNLRVLDRATRGWDGG